MTDSELCQQPDSLHLHKRIKIIINDFVDRFQVLVWLLLFFFKPTPIPANNVRPGRPLLGICNIYPGQLS